MDINPLWFKSYLQETNDEMLPFDVLLAVMQLQLKCKLIPDALQQMLLYTGFRQNQFNGSFYCKIRGKIPRLVWNKKYLVIV